MARLEALERVVANGGTNAAIAPPPASRPEPASPEEPGLAGAVEKGFVRDIGEGSGVTELARDAEGDDDVAEAQPARSSPDWGSVMRELSERKQKTSETIFKEAVVSRFDGQTLELVFPEDQQHLLGLAKDHRYLEPLQQVLKERLGSRMRLELRVAGDAPEAPSVDTDGAPRTEAPSPRPVPETKAQAVPVPDKSEGREPSRVRDPLAAQPPEPEADDVPDGGGLRGGRWYNPEPVRGVRDVSGVVRRSRRQAKRRWLEAHGKAKECKDVPSLTQTPLRQHGFDSP